MGISTFYVFVALTGPECGGGYQEEVKVCFELKLRKFGSLLNSLFSLHTYIIIIASVCVLFTGKIHKFDFEVQCAHIQSPFLKVQFILQIYIFDISFLCDLIQE